jgi:hypothetical protein
MNDLITEVSAAVIEVAASQLPMNKVLTALFCPLVSALRYTKLLMDYPEAICKD